MKKKGFTLVELLVVIAIIGMLASIVIVSMGGVRKKARDAKRESDIRQIANAMELCYSDNSCNGLASGEGYPAISISGTAPGRLTTTAIGNYLNPLPQDPGGGTNTSCSNTQEMSPGPYCAFSNPAGSGEYCIFARLSDGRVIAASERGVQYMTSTPANLSACP